MAKIAKKLQLSDADVNALMSGEVHLRMATIGPDTDINLTPMTFGWAGGKVYIFGRGQKIANLRKASTATVLVDVGSDWRELKGVMMRGHGIVLESLEEEQADKNLLDAKLTIGAKHGLKKEGMAVPYDATASGKSRRWIVFTPEKIVSWDNEKL